MLNQGKNIVIFKQINLDLDLDLYKTKYIINKKYTYY